jgi:hypothetical protein
MRSFTTCSLGQVYNWNEQVKEYEMGRASSMYGREAQCIQEFGGKARRKKTTRKIMT